MSTEIPIRQALNYHEAQALLAEDEACLKQMMQIAVELNALAEKAGALMKAYIEAYQKITAPARLRPMEGRP